MGNRVSGEPPADAFITGNAARLCGEALRAQILRLGNVSDAAMIGTGPEGLTLSDGGEPRRVTLPDPVGDYTLEAVESYDPPTTPLDDNGQGDPYAVFGTTAQMCELEVDLDLLMSVVVHLHLLSVVISHYHHAVGTQ